MDANLRGSVIQRSPRQLPRGRLVFTLCTLGIGLSGAGCQQFVQLKKIEYRSAEHRTPGNDRTLATLGTTGSIDTP